MVHALDTQPITMTTLPVSEVFGPVFQGEGPFTGRRCYFLRLGLCNLHCSWCDTAYTWDNTRFDVHAECPPRTEQELRDMLPDDGLLILSGGEPMIHQHNPVLRAVLNSSPLAVHVETNGTLKPSPWARARVDHFTVSPKLADQGDPEHRRIRPDVLADFAELTWQGKAIFKVVVRNTVEVELARRWFDQLHVSPAGRWVMPEGIDKDTIIDRARSIADAVAEAGLNLSLRQHVLLYGNERLR